MSTNVTESVILTFKAGTIIEEHVKALFKLLHGQKGYQGGVWGLWEEDPNKVHAFHQWDSISSRKMFTESAEFIELASVLGTAFDGPPTLYHCHMDDSFSETLKAPITEVLTIYQPGDSILDDLKDLVQLMKNAKGFHGGSSGPVVEELEFEGNKFKAYQAVVGWDSMEAHGQAFKDLGLATKFGPAFRVAKGKEMHHVKFRSGSG